MRNSNKKRRNSKKCKQNKNIRIPREIRGAVLKYRDTSFGSSNLLTSGNVLLLPPPAQGLGANNRVGDAIYVHHIDIVLRAHNEGATSNYLRFGLIAFKGYFPGPVLSDIFSVGPSLSIDVSSMYIPYYPGNFFTPLWDRLYTSCTNSDTDLIKYRGTKNCGFKTAFTPATNSQVSNVLCFYALSDSAVIPSPSYDIQFRVWYSDCI